MRRVILAVTGTIAGLVALLSFKSHVPSAPVAATTGGTQRADGGGGHAGRPADVRFLLVQAGHQGLQHPR